MSARTRTIWTFVITSTALFMVTLDNLVVTTAIPVIRKDLHASLSSLEWTVNAYTLTFAVLLLTGAALGDRFGRRRMFTIGIGIFTLGSIAAALAPSVEFLNVARAVQGVGGAIVMPLTLTILSAAVPAERRGLALGAWGGIAGLAVAFGPLVGGAIVQGISWQWIFWLNVPIGLVLIPLAWSRLAESYGPKARLDLPGLGLVSAGLFGIVWGVIRGNDAGLGVARDRRSRSSPARCWSPRSCCGSCAPRRRCCRCASSATATFTLANLVVAAHVLRDVRLDLPAVAVLPDGAGLLAVRLGPAHPPVDARADVHRADRGRHVRPDLPKAIIGTGLALQSVALAWMGLISTPTSPYRDLVAPFIIAGVGMALFFAPMANVVLSRRRPRGGGQGLRRQQRDPRARRRLRRRRARRRSSPTWAATERRPSSSTA